MNLIIHNNKTIRAELIRSSDKKKKIRYKDYENFHKLSLITELFQRVAWFQAFRLWRRRKKVCASLHYLNSWNGFNPKEGNRDIRDQQEVAELVNDFFPNCTLKNKFLVKIHMISRAY